MIPLQKISCLQNYVAVKEVHSCFDFVGECIPILSADFMRHPSSVIL